MSCHVQLFQCIILILIDNLLILTLRIFIISPVSRYVGICNVLYIIYGVFVLDSMIL